jgi:hypothetical protein
VAETTVPSVASSVIWTELAIQSANGTRRKIST